MPKITRQKPTTAEQPKATPSTNGDSIVQGLKLNVYGRGKTGKTRLVCSFPKPILLIGTEDGTKSICLSKKPKYKLADGAQVYSLWVSDRNLQIDFLRLAKIDTFELALKAAADKTWGYKTAALDHASGLQDLNLKDVFGLDDVPVECSWGMGDMRAWGAVGMQTKERLRQLLDLADRCGIHTPIIAHERNFKDDDTSSKIVTPRIGAALQPSVSDWLDGAVDYICQAFITMPDNSVEVQVGGESGTIHQPSGRCEYCLRIGPHPVYKTGFRTIGGSLPDFIVNPNFDKIRAVIEGRPVE